MSQKAKPRYWNDFTDVFDAVRCDQDDDLPDIEGLSNDDRTVVLAPEDMEPDGAIHPRGLSTKPEATERGIEYKNNDGELYELLKIEYKHLDSRNRYATVKHYYKMEYVEQIADVFDVGTETVVENLQSRFDRGDMYLAKYSPEDSDYVVILCPHSEP